MKEGFKIRYIGKVGYGLSVENIGTPEEGKRNENITVISINLTM